MTPALRRAIAATAVATAVASTAQAQAPDLPVDESVREQSCKSLQGGTAGMPDQAPAGPIGGIPATWPEAPAGLLPKHVYLRSHAETLHRLYEVAARDGRICARSRDESGPWRTLPIPLCFDGRVASISL